MEDISLGGYKNFEGKFSFADPAAIESLEHRRSIKRMEEISKV